MRFDTDDCGVCHKPHKGLEVHELLNRIYDEGVVWTHFVICPTMEKHILVRIVNDKKEVEK